MDFKNGTELLLLCEQYGCPVSEIMKRRECDMAETTVEALDTRMRTVLGIMKKASTEPLSSPRRSMGGLLGRRDVPSVEICSPGPLPGPWEYWRSTAPWG